MLTLSHKQPVDLVLGKLLIAHGPEHPRSLSLAFERAAGAVTIAITWTLLLVWWGMQ